MFQSLSLVARRTQPTHRKAQKLNHDISVDLSAMAINYHQMVCRRDIIKSNGTDYFKIFFRIVVRWCCSRVEKQWNAMDEFSFRLSSLVVQIISIFNFHCMNACMHECENWYQNSRWYFLRNVYFGCSFQCVCSMVWDENTCHRVAMLGISCQISNSTAHIFT